MTTIFRRRGALAALLAGAAIGLAACSGSSPPTAAGSPTVASLGTSTGNGGGNGNSTTIAGGSSTTTGGGSSTTPPKSGNATQLLNEWATCMRSNGDPNQADPTIDAYGVININIGQGASETLSGQVHSGGGPCSNYLASAQSALRAANPVAPPPDQTEQVKYVNCMRANGVPNYPYPTGNTTNFNGTGVDPNSPFVENANKVCGKQIGAPAWWISGTGPPGDVSVSSCNGSASFCSGPPRSGGNRSRGAGRNGGAVPANG